jgi:hypothetical protein
MTIKVIAPDYSIPGTAERVEREVCESEWAAMSSVGSSTLRYLVWLENRRRAKANEQD